jgi:hypothetical protein
MLFNLKSSFFSEKKRIIDEQFWEEYSKPKRKGEKCTTLSTQEIKIYKTDKEWEFSDRFSLMSTDLLKILKELEPNKKTPFCIIDVREESEFLIYKFPEKNIVIYM